MRDIQDFLYRYADNVKPYGGGTDLRVDCPFCDDRVGDSDTGQHLHVSLSKETCHCFRCEYSRSWIGLIMDMTGLDYIHALGELYTAPNPVDFDTIEKKNLFTHLGGDVWESGFWKVSTETATRLIGADIYFHEKKKDPSFFGGRILDFRPSDSPAFLKRIIFKFEASAKHSGVTTDANGWGMEKKIVF